jgi:hypothetical protein
VAELSRIAGTDGASPDFGRAGLTYYETAPFTRQLLVDRVLELGRAPEEASTPGTGTRFTFRLGTG